MSKMQRYLNNERMRLYRHVRRQIKVLEGRKGKETGGGRDREKENKNNRKGRESRERSLSLHKVYHSNSPFKKRSNRGELLVHD